MVNKTTANSTVSESVALIYPGDGSPELIRTLGFAKLTTAPISDSLAVLNYGAGSNRANKPVGGLPDDPSLAVVSFSEGDEEAEAVLRAIRRQFGAATSILLLVSAGEVGAIAGIAELFDDFCLNPFHPIELGSRIECLAQRNPTFVTLQPTDEHLITYEDLTLNTETYQAAIDQRPLDLTYMEYELLKFLASTPGKVYSREILLQNVWGYDYYGGARTVDVHIRRLRSKLGEERARWIHTVRSVGYSFGSSSS